MSPTNNDILKTHRHQIDHLNHELVKILAERFETVLQIGQIKKDRQLPTTDPEREKQMLTKLEIDWNERPISTQVKWDLVAPIFVELFRASANAQS